MVSPRIRSCASPTASSRATVVSLSGASESTRTIRPGCSVCADRTNPHTAAPARSVTSSPGKATAPRVATTSIPEACSASQDCSAASASCVRRYVAASEPSSAAADSKTSCAGASTSDPGETGDQITSKIRSGPDPDTAAINCCCDTGRATIDATDNTGNPNPSANSTETADG